MLESTELIEVSSRTQTPNRLQTAPGAVLRFDPIDFLQELVKPWSGLRASVRRRKMARLGRNLAEKIGRQRGPFTVAYLENVLAGRQDVGAPLEYALRAAWFAQNGACPILGAFEPIECRSRGNVEPGALILAESRRCRACGQPFIPASGNQVYCSRECRVRSRRR